MYISFVSGLKITRTCLTINIRLIKSKATLLDFSYKGCC